MLQCWKEPDMRSCCASLGVIFAENEGWKVPYETRGVVASSCSQ